MSVETKFSPEFFKRPRSTGEIIAPRPAQLLKQGRVGGNQVVLKRVAQVHQRFRSPIEFFEEFDCNLNDARHFDPSLEL